MRLLIGCVFVSFAFAAQGQRVALDFSSALDNMYTSVLYCHIIKPTWYVKAGLSKGNYGRGNFVKNRAEAQAGNPMVSAYASVNDGLPGLHLQGYDTRVKGVALEFGIGKFIEIGPVHTVRFDLQLKGYRITEEFWAAYVAPAPDTLTRGKTFEFKRNCLSIGPEIFHAIRISGRLTFYYGLKMPFYLPIRSEGYHPRGTKSQSIGVHPNLCLGMSCALTRKNKAGGEP